MTSARPCLNQWQCCLIYEVKPRHSWGDKLTLFVCIQQLAVQMTSYKIVCLKKLSTRFSFPCSFAWRWNEWRCLRNDLLSRIYYLWNWYVVHATIICDCMMPQGIQVKAMNKRLTPDTSHTIFKCKKLLQKLITPFRYTQFWNNANLWIPLHACENGEKLTIPSKIIIITTQNYQWKIWKTTTMINNDGW